MGLTPDWHELSFKSHGTKASKQSISSGMGLITFNDIGKIWDTFFEQNYNPFDKKINYLAK